MINSESYDDDNWMDQPCNTFQGREVVASRRGDSSFNSFSTKLRYFSVLGSLNVKV
jgi:hypothetical protein